MATDIVMPNLGFDAESGVLLEWLKQPGDTVRRGDIIAIVESDKAAVELESFSDGILLAHLYAEGEEVPVGQVIARVGNEDETVNLAPTTQITTAPTVSQAADTPPPSVAVTEISPVARRMAIEHDIDLSQVQGSGARGRITREDVAVLIPANGDAPIAVLALPKVRKAAREAGVDLTQITPTGKVGQITMQDLVNYQAAQQPPASAPPEGMVEIAISRMRQTIGKRLQKSKNEAPHFYVTGEFDLENAFAVLNDYPDPQPRINDLLQFITVHTLRQVPEINATYEDDRLYQNTSVNLAIAVALEDGLITPVLHAAERFSLVGLAQESHALINRTRANRLQASDLQGGTFTISNLGIIRQVDHFTAVINPPQVGILAVGTVKPRPVVIDGGLHIRRTVHLTLSGDHRVVDGMHLGHFMAAFQNELDRLS